MKHVCRISKVFCLSVRFVLEENPMSLWTIPSFAKWVVDQAGNKLLGSDGLVFSGRFGVWSMMGKVNPKSD